MRVWIGCFSIRFIAALHINVFFRSVEIVDFVSDCRVSVFLGCVTAQRVSQTKCARHLGKKSLFVADLGNE